MPGTTLKVHQRAEDAKNACGAVPMGEIASACPYGRNERRTVPNTEREDRVEAPAASPPTPAYSPTVSSVALQTLAPEYDEEQHGTYLRRLQEAITEPKNLNIALTGRYGAGKSSVLEGFLKEPMGKTLRLAISTLGPNNEDATLTNRIQKELIKQLVYSASPPTLKRLRVSRSIPLSRWQAFGEAIAGVALLGLFLALMGWLPPVVGTDATHPWYVRGAAWIGLASLMVVVATTARVLTYNRLVLTDVSAGGATVKLTERTRTYFDEYLDDIVSYFDSEGVDIVLFEDLDRFNDPHIFESLRELNTLLNKTPERVAKGIPLRFVYAVRDSLFEKLGADTAKAVDDAAAAETVRANRTKFFDLVIPLVPFISHRNARELLTDLLVDAGVTGIDRQLVNLIAQHTTDMRLLRNMCNEYLVFAERLLETDRVAPGLNPSNLFALVAYKNFHLEDFEQIARRSSNLDTLYRCHRDLVRTSVQVLEQRKRDLIADGLPETEREPTAHILGDRLRAVAEAVRSASGQRRSYTHTAFRVGGDVHDTARISAYAFWEAVAVAGGLTILVGQYAGHSAITVALDRKQLMMLAPECDDVALWREKDASAVTLQLAQIDRDIALLRGADFAALASNPQFRTPAPLTPPDAPEPQEQADQDYPRPSFVEHVDLTLTSRLSGDLVKHGYLDRNFALYAAQFYGHFTGVDVATFMVQSVQTNTMDLDYQFDSPAAIANLLAEADEDFTRTVAAYNIQVLDYLLGTDDPRSVHVVDQITSFDDDAQTFMASYFTSGEQRENLAASLASQGWRGVFTYTVTSEDVPDDVRPALVDAALVSIQDEQDYDLNTEVTRFIGDHSHSMSAFTQSHDDAVTRTLAMLLERAGVSIRDLAPLSLRLKELLVERSLYALTAPNLRVALDVAGGVPIDRVIASKTVYQYCLGHADEYLAAVQKDDETPHSVLQPDVLASALTDMAAKSTTPWTDAQIQLFIASADPGSRLPDLAAAPVPTWPHLAEAKLFAASLANVEAYLAELGRIDDHLAALILESGAIDTRAETSSGAEIETRKQCVAEALLNTGSLNPAQRVGLVDSLGLETRVQPSGIHPEASNLFALLLKHDLVEDDALSFAHFQRAGWAALRPAIIESSEISNFITPDLLRGFISEVLTDTATARKLGRVVMASLDQYVADDDVSTLGTAAEYAQAHGIALTPEAVVRIAQAERADTHNVLCLLEGAVPAAAAHHIKVVFSALGDPYSCVTQPGASFEVAHDDLHGRLLRVLQDAGLATHRKKTGLKLYTVRVN